ncbi:MAG: Peptidase M16 inactive domain protein [Smithella sp. PtaU1.Bin162]|nr:MAG: Peptidase M16 inactive domain protein [Smithella sp. PtaU1.Bin162]
MKGTAKKFKLSNGLTLLLESTSYNSVMLGISIRIGSKNDPDSLHGMAHLCEHIIIRSCDKKISSTDRDNLKIHAFTEREETFIFIRSLKDKFSSAIRWFEYFCSQHNITNEDLFIEKNIVSEEIHAYDNSEISKIESAFFRKAFVGKKMSHSISGNISGIKQIQLADVNNHHSLYSIPTNLVIAVSGDLDNDRILNTIESITKHLKGSAITNRIHSGHPKPFRVQVKSNLELTYFIYGFEVPERSSEERLLIYALSNYLGEEDYSKLYQVIRKEKGLAYTIASEYQLFSDIGFLLIKGLTSQNNFSEVMLNINNILEDCKNMNFDSVLLHNIAKHMKKNLLMNLDDINIRIIRLLKHELWFSEFYNIDDDLLFIDNLLSSNINIMAKRVFSGEGFLCHSI